jgi:hypothetical protein
MAHHECSQCGRDLGEIVQGDARVDDATGMFYCRACWLASARNCYAYWLRRTVRIPLIIELPEISHFLAAFLYDGVWTQIFEVGDESCAD